MFRAVLDADVFVSAAIHPNGPPGRIIEQFLRRDAFTLVLSDAIVDEVVRILAYPKVRGCVYRCSGDQQPGRDPWSRPLLHHNVHIMVQQDQKPHEVIERETP